MVATASVVIPTLGRYNRLAECIQSILDQNVEVVPEVIVIVDGENAVDIEERLRNEFAHCDNLVINTSLSRRGSPRAKNEGARIAKGEVLVFVDDDIHAEDGWLARILDSFEDHVVGVGGSERKRNMTDTFHRIWHRLHGDATGKITLGGQVIANFTPAKKTPEIVDCLAGCNMAFVRAAFDRVGGFDERYSGNAYREETDLCVRIRREGNLLFVPDAVVNHYEDQIGGNTSSSIEDWNYWYHRNNTYFFLKNFGDDGYSGKIRHITSEIVLATARSLSSKTLAPFSTMYKGYRDGTLAYGEHLLA